MLRPRKWPIPPVQRGAAKADASTLANYEHNADCSETVRLVIKAVSGCDCTRLTCAHFAIDVNPRKVVSPQVRRPGGWGQYDCAALRGLLERQGEEVTAISLSAKPRWQCTSHMTGIGKTSHEPS